MTRRFRAFSAMTLAGAAVLVFHSAAFAQQEAAEAKGAEAKSAEAKGVEAAKPEAATPEPAATAAAKPQPPQELPPEYAPPPGYHHGNPPPAPPGYPPPGNGPYYHEYYGPPGYPPPRYYRPHYYQPGPPRFFPEPTTYRQFFFGFGLGVGGVAVFPHQEGTDNSSRAGLGYNLRFGFGVSPRWSIVLAADGAQAYFNGTNVTETAWTIGPQVFITPKLYARAGVGAATYNQDSCDDWGGWCDNNGWNDSGMAGMAAIGFEFMQSYHTALALEASGTFARFPNKDKVSTFGLNFVLNVF
jgi:hypothetical protein